MVCNREWAALAYALIVPSRKMADNLRTLHFNSEMLFGKIDGREQRKVRIPFATAWTANLSYCP
jgi:hypothetical protein